MSRFVTLARLALLYWKDAALGKGEVPLKHSRCSADCTKSDMKGQADDLATPSMLPRPSELLMIPSMSILGCDRRPTLACRKGHTCPDMPHLLQAGWIRITCFGMLKHGALVASGLRSAPGVRDKDMVQLSATRQAATPRQEEAGRRQATDVVAGDRARLHPVFSCARVKPHEGQSDPKSGFIWVRAHSAPVAGPGDRSSAC